MGAIIKLNSELVCSQYFSHQGADRQEFSMALNLEPVYQEIFQKFKTRKKFVIKSVEKNLLTVEQDEEICGQKEPRKFEFKSPREFEEFVRQENRFELDIENQIKGNTMPYR